MLCLNYLNKTVELLFILYNFAIVPSVGTGIKAVYHKHLEQKIVSYPPWVRGLKLTFLRHKQRIVLIVPSVGTGIKAYIPVEDLLAAIIVPSVGTGIKTYHL